MKLGLGGSDLGIHRRDRGVALGGDGGLHLSGALVAEFLHLGDGSGLGGVRLGLSAGGGLEALGGDGLLDLSGGLVTLVGYPALYLGEESGESGEIDVLVSHVVSFRRWLMD